MSDRRIARRDALKSFLAGIPMVGLDWASFPVGAGTRKGQNEFDAIIIGAGLGGLACAAAFARQGFKPLVLEQHSRPGGYATTFKRPGGFVFDVSLHSTAAPARDGIHNLIPGFPEITDVEFIAHSSLYRVILPDHDIRVPQKDVKGYKELLTSHFPDEKEGIDRIFDDMVQIYRDIGRISTAQGQVDAERMASDYPDLHNAYTKTWGELVDARIRSPKLKAIISSQWGYYGLPPSQLASYYYAMPALEFFETGGYYPRGRSQRISDTFVEFIEGHGGTVLLRSRVEEILVKDRCAYGVRTRDGEEYTGKFVVSNANGHDTFRGLLKENDYLEDYLEKQRQFRVSLSSFQVFLGLKEDLVRKSGLTDSEIFCEAGYDTDACYAAARKGDIRNSSFYVTLYDNIYQGYSPQGKNTVNLLALQGYDHWEQYEAGYFDGNKTAYRAEKERMADILISRAEKSLLPGLSQAIEVKEIGTPLTNVRYTSNYRGAIYGWDQTLNNSGPSRLPHDTPIKNLYLSGAWTSPGHGYGGVIPSGLQCFGEIMART